MTDALETTFYCDHDHPEIQAAAARLKQGGGAPAGVAMRAFTFVRDGLPFGIDLYRRKASETLRRGYGVCWNKNLLLVALLRCNGIPARFGSVAVRRTFCEPALGAMHRLNNDPFHHCLTHVLLDGRWTILDPTLDRRTYDAFFAPRGVAWGIDWDGKGDVWIYTESIVGAAVVHEDVDATLERRLGNTELPAPLALLGNACVNAWMWRRAAARTRAGPPARAAPVASRTP